MVKISIVSGSNINIYVFIYFETDLYYLRRNDFKPKLGWDNPQWLVGYWSVISWQHRRPYQEGYCLVTVCTNGDYSAIPPGDQTASTMTWYSTQSHYTDTEPTNLCASLIMPSAWLGSDKYQILSHWFDSTGSRTPDLPHGRFALYRFGQCARLSRCQND